MRRALCVITSTRPCSLNYTNVRKKKYFRVQVTIIALFEVTSRRKKSLQTRLRLDERSPLPPPHTKANSTADSTHRCRLVRAFLQESRRAISRRLFSARDGVLGLTRPKKHGRAKTRLFVVGPELGDPVGQTQKWVFVGLGRCGEGRAWFGGERHSSSLR